MRHASMVRLRSRTGATDGRRSGRAIATAVNAWALFRTAADQPERQAPTVVVNRPITER